jgi:hypothetical protein
MAQFGEGACISTLEAAKDAANAAVDAGFLGWRGQHKESSSPDGISCCALEDHWR